MTKLKIDPGICGFVTIVTAQGDEDEVQVNVASGCESIKNMMTALGSTFDPYEVCLTKPGVNEFYQYAQEHFPVHAGCPILSGIVKCVEAQCNLALKKTVTMEFLEEV